MGTNLRFGMLETVYTGQENIRQVEEIVVEDNKEVKKIRQVSDFSPASCKDEKCNRMVKHEEPCFIDTWTENGDVFCDPCGKCRRYERKMADRRGELDALRSAI